MIVCGGVKGIVIWIVCFEVFDVRLIEEIILIV